MTKREALIAEANQAEEEALAIRHEMSALLGKGYTPKYKELQEAYNILRRKALCLKSQAQAVLPVQIEGFLGEEVEEVDHDEHGRTMEIGWWLGCPNVNRETYFSPKLQYSFENDISEILKLNAGKYLRVTIEAIDVGSRGKCETCPDRFKCYTMEWKF